MLWIVDAWIQESVGKSTSDETCATFVNLGVLFAA